MIDWDAARIAAAAGAELVQAPSAEHAGGPARVVIDSRELAAGDLFVGLEGTRSNGGDYAAEALAKGAWGVLLTSTSAERLVGSGEAQPTAPSAVVLGHRNPLRALQLLAAAWRSTLEARVVGITGSTGKTSTKDILAALLASAAPPLRTFASPENFNTEIGLPLAILAAPHDTQALVLEMAMRARGQIAELAAIADPDVGLIVNIGPVHLQQLGSREAVAAAKAELIAGLVSPATIVIPAEEPLLAQYLRDDVRAVTFGRGGDVELVDVAEDGEVLIRAGARTIAIRPSFAQAYNLHNLLAAVAVALALDVEPPPQLDVSFSGLRGERVRLPGELLLINDCYNANPMSMRAALDDLAETARGRRVAVLGDMLELGEDERSLHREIGAHAAARGVELLVTVGPRAKAIGAGIPVGAAVEVRAVAAADEAANLLPALLRAGDTVLVKGSRGMRLEQVAQSLAESADERLQPLGGTT
jgi:UDP-N-acetylmuramoyl-tripeptide--D-alanyl-D-alanine ligase